MDRRNFIKVSSVAAAGASLIGNAKSWAGANDRIRVGCIGMGGRGIDRMLTADKMDGVEVVTVSDPDENRMNEAADRLEKERGRRPQMLADMRKIFDDGSIDAVTITNCNHWHALSGIWACQAGKHAYVEKPVCHNLWEGRKLVEAARKYNRVVQGGTQRRSSGLFRKAVQLLHDGIIGEIHSSRSLVFGNRDSIGFKPDSEPPENLHWDLWLGPAQEQPYNANLAHYNWHWFWDFGNGELGNNGSHIIDVIRWGLNKGLPNKIHSTGGRYGYKDQGQTPNTQTTTYEYDDGTYMVCEVRGLYSNSEADGIRWGGMFYGSEGYMTLDDKQYQIFKGRNDKPEPDMGKLDSEEHLSNFINAVRAGKPEMLSGDIEEVYLSCGYCNLGNIAYLLNREVQFDPKTERFVGDDEANAMLSRNYREPFVVPENV